MDENIGVIDSSYKDEQERQRFWWCDPEDKGAEWGPPGLLDIRAV